MTARPILNRLKRSLMVGAAVLPLAVGLPVLAQEAATTSAEPMLEEIVVTARKRAETLESAPFGGRGQRRPDRPARRLDA